MTTSLIDGLKQLASPEVSARLASSLGEPEQNVSRGLTSAMPSMLTGMLGKTGDSSAMQQIFSMITDKANDGSVLDNPTALVGGAASAPISGLSGRFLSTIFGNRGSAVNDALAKSSGLKIGAISTLMQVAGPLVLGMLGKRVRDSRLDASSFGRLLNEERDSIKRATPPEVYSALGLEQRAAADRPVVEERYEERYEERFETPRVEATRTYTREPEATGRSWFWPAAATVAALALLWGMWPRHREPDIAFVDTSRTAVSGGEVVPIAPPVTAPSIAVIRLPSGDSLSAGEGSPESRLLVLLRDPSRPVDQTSWFALDRMQFETSSATLRPESQSQITDVAKILKEFPNSKVKIGGFTDNVGDDAANKKLSKERAESARAAIIKSGVSPSRVSAEGYGSAMPVADNSTEAGRAQNRRIAILVVGK